MRLSLTPEQAIHFANLPMNYSDSEDLCKQAMLVADDSNPEAYVYVSARMFVQGGVESIRVRISKTGEA